ncbi:NAD(P)-dependent oxidoreductase [Olivibacter sp. CPCC 100613]|uniref:NAD-dependent epimerase/dehydratase family protein n=1 Tax=Olivibacter sp. CPCC 100613 TaxID=3079931 RepID=UPI002FFA512A
MKSVVLGASGFLGQACVIELLNRGDDVIAFDLTSKKVKFNDDEHEGTITYVTGDIQDRSKLLEVFEGVDEVYLLAGKLGTSELNASLRNAIAVNIIGAIDVFDAALTRRVPRVLLACKPNAWLNVYTITKHTAEKIAHLYSRYNPIQISTLCYFNLFGPSQKLYPIRKIIPVFAAQAIRGLPIQVYGDGLQTVDMLYSKDAAKITVDIMRHKFNPNTLDCGTGRAMTVIEVAQSVNDYFNNAAGLSFVPMRNGESPNTHLVANISALENTIGSIQFTPYQEALAATLAYYENIREHEIDTALNYFGIKQTFDVLWT